MSTVTGLMGSGLWCNNHQSYEVKFYFFLLGRHLYITDLFLTYSVTF